MLTSIGGRRGGGDIVELLLECHGRIRRFIGLARRLASGDEVPAPEAAEAAAGVSRYFLQALPLHARDEEESIAPRLRGRDPEVDGALARMSREHREHEAPLAALVELCQRIAAAPAERAAVAPRLAEVAAELQAHFEAHLALEESVLFPAIRRLLSPGEQAAIVGELRARRG